MTIEERKSGPPLWWLISVPFMGGGFFVFGVVCGAFWLFAFLWWSHR